MPSKKSFIGAIALLPVALFIGSNFPSKFQELFSVESQSLIRNLPVVVRQLESESSVAPVELLRPAARLSAENQLEQYSCIIKNNTEKIIVAFSLTWDIITEAAGKKSSVRELQVINSLIHPDVQDSYNSGVAPKAESPVESGPTYFESDTSVKRVGVSIDYVEFEDGTSLGPDLNGRSSHQIAKVREGASKYKDWLAQTYEKTGESATLILQHLQSDSIPDDINLSTPEMKQGAYAYRIRLLKQYKNGGSAVIQKIFNN